MGVTATPAYVQGAAITVGSALTAANTAMDGTGTVGTIATAGANGAIVDTLYFKAKGTCVATVARIFINNGSDPTTAGNNSLILEVDLAATTASNSVSNVGYIDTRLRGLVLPAGYKITWCLGTEVVGGWIAIASIKNL